MNRLAILVLLFAPLGAVAIPVTAGAETHGNCIQFDANGNIVPGSVVPSCTETFSQQGGQPSFMAAQDCSGNPGTLEMDVTHQVFHVTVNGAGDIWLTGTTTGAASFTPDAGGPAALGHWTSWFGGSLNRSSSVQHDTFNLILHTATGTFQFHMINHMSITPGGIINQFSKSSNPCG